MESEILKYEQARVTQVQAEIADQLAETTAKIATNAAERKKVEASYGDTAKVNLLEIDDAMETNAAIQQQKQLVALVVENETILNQREKNLRLLTKSPYFGRIDISEDGEQESLYIGTSTLINEADEFLVYDWRAPISELYYNGTLGQTSYQTPMGQIPVDLQLKRQFKISGTTIEKMFDTNETIEDDILQDVLSDESGTHMKNIVATIQQKQNEIIKNTNAELLVVQGVAGSGKTSAILQRIAYLLYHAKTELTSEQIILFSPNRLFSNYISEVLPSLGEKNMRQVTWHEFLARRHQGFQIQTLFERFEQDQQHLPDSAQQIRKFKQSHQMSKLLQQFINSLTIAKLPFIDLTINQQTLISATEINEIYQQQPATALRLRLENTKENLLQQIKQLIKKRATSPEIENQLENLSDEEYQQLLGQRQDSFADFSSEYRYLTRKLAKRELTPLITAVQNNFYLDIYQLYLQFLQFTATHFAHEAKAYQEMITEVSMDLELHHLKIDDAVLIMYLRDLLFAENRNFNIKYLFIDEMQDYSEIFLAYLAFSFPKARFTLLGDQAQNLFGPATYKENAIATYYQNIFPQKRLTYRELNTSYRSTKPITDLGKQILENPEITAFNREGPAPVFLKFKDQSELLTKYQALVQSQLQQHTIVAIITKTTTEAQFLANNLHSELKPHLITEQTRSLKEGLLIMPIYLAKGLEFDCVIAHDLSQTNYHQPKDREVLYTIVSRSMHELTLTSVGDFSEFLATKNTNN